MYGLHLPGAFRAYEQQKGPKKLFIGPPTYLERPLYQLQYESLRWFDYWLKGIDTGIMDEPPVSLYIMPTGQWKQTSEWPLPETRWTPFYLHENNLLWEREHFPYEGSTSFSDSPYQREFVEFTTPRFVEETEVIGPSVLVLYGATTEDEILWFVSMKEVDADGKERTLTKGWLRGSQRALNPELSKPWAPYQLHKTREPLVPGDIYEFQIPIVPTGNLFKMGSRLKLRISCCDEPPAHSLEATSIGHLRRHTAARITIFHNEDYPSRLLLPITKGNLIGTFISSGRPYVNNS